MYVPFTFIWQKPAKKRVGETNIVEDVGLQCWLRLPKIADKTTCLAGRAHFATLSCNHYWVV